MAQVTGTVYVKMDGKVLMSKEGAKLNTGGKERTTQIAGGRVVGYSEKVVAARVECTLAHMADTDVEALNGMTNGTVAFETDTGKGFLVNAAHTTKPCELTGGEGDLSFECEGEPAVPM